MTFKAFIFTYVLGGLTFIPLVLAAIVIPAWLLLPRIENGEGGQLKQVVAEQRREKKDDKEKEDTTAAEGAEGTFAVLRRYDYAAAHAALTARATTGNAVAGTGAAADGGVGETVSGSESVYQSMYRSVFDRGKGSAAPTNSISMLETEDAGTGNVNDKIRRKPVVPANIFYIVLRHGHLMLYDSPAQIEVRHVIRLAHHSISLSVSGTDDAANLREGDLFIKRTAIVLTPTELPNGHLQPNTAPSKPFFLFSLNYSQKEDFYHALLSTRTYPPIPEPLYLNDMIKLQSALHSTTLTPETRAFNALVSRLFLALYHTDRAKTFIQSRIERKISRVQKPTFIASLAVHSIDLGDAAPVLSNPRLKDLNIEGDMTVAFDVRYTGGLKLTFSALAKLDLGPRFKTRTADLVLATSLQRLHGHLLVRIKSPPSNRVWFCFDGAPEMDIKIEPVVSQRQITYQFVLRAIEERIRAVVAETLVKPNWDDIPFYDTQNQKIRGGIWRDDGRGEPATAEVLKERNEKTSSMPALPTEADSVSAASSGAETPPRKASSSSAAYVNHAALADLKRRSIGSLAARASTPPASSTSDRPLAPPPTRPLRSPSFTSPSASAPSLKLDESPANVDPSRNGDESQAHRKWRIRSAATPLPSRREAVDAIRALSTPKAHDSDADALTDEAAGQGADVRPPIPTTSSLYELSLKSPKRMDTNMSTSTTTSAASAASAATTRSAQQRRQNILAAAGAATNAARNWSWNALASAKKNSPILRSGTTPSGAPTGATPSGASIVTRQQPIGRGQPLPPPGVPLPGPNKGLFGALGTSAKKKPVLPPRRSTTDEWEIGKETAEVSVSEVPDDDEHDAQTTLSDEFGPWRENSGAGLELEDQDSERRTGESISVSEASGDEGVVSMAETEEDDATPIVEKKIPPPLPARRDTQPVESENSEPPLGDGSTDTSVKQGSENEMMDEDDDEEIVAIAAPIEEEGGDGVSNLEFVDDSDEQKLAKETNPISHHQQPPECVSEGGSTTDRLPLQEKHEQKAVDEVGKVS